MTNEFEIKSRIKRDILQAIMYGPANELEVRLIEVVNKIYSYMEVKNGIKKESKARNSKKGRTREQSTIIGLGDQDFKKGNA